MSMVYSNTTKNSRVVRIFNDIAERYDFINLIISLGFSWIWRKKALDFCLPKSERALVLDLCSGTGAMLFKVFDRSDEFSLGVGVDLSRRMLTLARKRANQKGIHERVFFIECDAHDLPLRDELFDCIITAFCLRSIEDLSVFFREAYRVLVRGGSLVALDLSQPSNNLIKVAYNLYLRYFVEPVGNLLSGRQHYQFIRESLQSFPSKEKLAQIIAESGFSNVRYYEFNLGVVSIHVGEKL